MAFVGSAIGGSALTGLLIGGGSIASGLIGSNAAKSASEAQVNAENNALGFQNSILDQNNARYNETKAQNQGIYDNTRAQNQDTFDRTSGVFQPYLDAGKNATYSLQSLYGPNADYSQFTKSPDYAFAQQQGELGLTRAENARGLNLSGGALKDVAQFNQGLASQQFGNYFNRLMGLSQLGQSAAGASANFASGFMNNNSGLASNFIGSNANLATGANTNATAMAGQIGNTMGNIGQSQASGMIGSANAISGGINNGITNSLLLNSMNRSSYAQNNNNSLPSFSGSGATSLNTGNVGPWQNPG